MLALTVPWDQAALVVVEEKATLGLALVGDLVRSDKVMAALQVMEAHEAVAVVVLAVQAAVQMAAPANVLLGFPAATGLQGLSQGVILQVEVAVIPLVLEALEVVALGLVAVAAPIQVAALAV